MSEHDVVVVGGGISGMSFAQESGAAGLQTLVLESTDSVGGCLQSRRLAGGFWYELGAHTCYNSYAALLSKIEQGPGLNALLPRAKVPFRLLVDGAVVPIGKRLRLFELLTSVPRVALAKKTGRTVREYYGRIVGRKNYDEVFGPLFSAVPSQPADDFPADMLFKKRARRKDVLRSFTLKEGLQSAVDALAAAPGVAVRTGAEVTGVTRTGTGFALELSGGEQVAARRLVLAAPPPVGARLLREVAPAVAEALARIAHAEIHTLGVAVKADDVKLEPVAGIVPTDGRFFSAVSRDTVPDAAHRGFAFHARPGSSRDARLAQAAKVLGTDRFVDVTTRSVVLPSPTLGHHDLVRSIEGALAGSDSLYVTGNYFGGLAIEDCVLRSQAEAARLRGTL